jgi:hypothetical protein
MKAYGEVVVQIHIFLTSALVGGEWSASPHGRFTPGIHWIGGWVGVLILVFSGAKNNCYFLDTLFLYKEAEIRLSI